MRGRKLQIESLEDRRMLAFNLYAEFFTSAFDPQIANYAQSPTMVSVADGLWSDPATWGGALPGVGDRVHVNHDVEYDVDSLSTVAAININPGAELSFRPDMDTRLKVGTILVLDGGTLEVGRPGDPIQDAYSAEIVFAGTLQANDTSQHGVGLIVLNGTFTTNGRNVDERFMRLATNISAGQTQVTLTDSVDWQPGDELFIPDKSAAAPWTNAEYPVVQSVSGNIVTFTSPLQYDNPGASGNRMHVANLSGNILFRSANPNGTRGHILLLERSEIDVHDAVFEELGRTTVDPLDPITNHPGRYSIHLHHMYGPEYPSAGKAWNISDNVFQGGERWGLAVHDSHWGTASNNVLIDIEGAGIALQGGGETGNVIEKNFTALHIGSGDSTFSRDPDKDNGHEGAGIWMRGSNNIIRDNVVANAAHAGIFVWSRFTGDKEKVPAYVGADPRFDFMLSDVEQQSALEFSGNEVYASAVGLKTDGVAGRGGEWVATGQKVWRTDKAIETLYVGKIRLDDLDLDGTGGQSTGIWVGYGGRLTLNNPDIRMFATGVYTGNQLTVNGGFFDNHATDINLNYEKPGNNPRVITLADVGFSNRSTVRIRREWIPTFQSQSFMVPNDIVVTNFNGVTGDNFIVYMDEQDPSYVPPFSGMGPSGVGNQKFSPEAGLTNQQLWDKYRLAAGGRVTPATATIKAKVSGKVGPVPTDLTKPKVSNVAVERIDSESLRFTWETDEPATSTVEWYPTDYVPVGRHGYIEAVDEVLKTSHDVMVDGLPVDTVISYVPRSTNASGLTSSDLGFGGQEHKTYKVSTVASAPPTIYYQQVKSITDTSAVFELVTTGQANAVVDVFRKENNEQVAHLFSGDKQSHVLSATGLDADTEYYASFGAWNGQGVSGGNKDFRTLQSDPAVCIRKWW